MLSRKRTCEICKKEFKGDQSRILECEHCEGHYCAKCVKLSENEYDMTSAMKDFHWYCVGCEPKILHSFIHSFYSVAGSEPMHTRK